MSGPTGTRSSETSTLDSRRRLKPRSVTLWEQAAMEMPISLGSDDTLTVWCNGEKLLSQNVLRPCTPDSDQLTLKLRPGKNKLLMKICQGDGEWAFYFAAKVPAAAPVVTQAFEDISERVGLGISGIGGKVSELAPVSPFTWRVPWKEKK